MLFWLVLSRVYWNLLYLNWGLYKRASTAYTEDAYCMFDKLSIRIKG
jgi:hypothetical protein